MGGELEERLKTEIEKEIIEKITKFAKDRVETQMGDWWEEFLTVNVRQNIASFSDAMLKELDGYVQAEKASRGF